jgi:penicillin-binding protein 1A
MWRLRRAFFVLALLGIAGVAAGAYMLAQIELPPEEFQAQTTFVCAADVQEGCNQDNSLVRLFGEQDRVDVTLDQVPQVLIDAVIAAEDRDFFSHQGVDPIGIARAAWNDVRGGATQGGSTITQQYVKNVYLTNDRTLSRKVREAVLAIRLEQELSKEEILERYLNTIYFGRGTYGIGAAARTYFGRNISELTVAESAYLAGLIRSPEGGDAARDPEEGTRRRRFVLRAMREEGYITDAQYVEADARPWVVRAEDNSNADTATIEPRSEREGVGQVLQQDIGTEYLVPFILDELQTLGFEPNEVYNGGLRVYTSLDLDAQRAAVEAIQATLNLPEDPPAALVAIDDLGFVRAMVGGDDFDNDKVNRALGQRGGGSGRQTGSTMKPFVLAAAIRAGVSIESRFNSPGELVIPGGNAGADYTARNFAGTEQGELSLIDATRVSSNTVFVALIDEIGPEAVVQLAADAGLDGLEPFLSLALGAQEVSPYDFTAAFATFANGGTYIEPTLITRVELPDGRVVTPPQERREVLTREQNSQVVHSLRGVIDAGTGTAAQLGVPAAGKTGTTQDNRDAWFAGFTPNGWTAVVWMGYDPVDLNGDGQLDPVNMNNVHGREVTGGSFPAEIWQAFMTSWTEGVDVGQFPSVTTFPGELVGEELETTTTTGPRRPLCNPGEPASESCRTTTTTGVPRPTGPVVTGPEGTLPPPTGPRSPTSITLPGPTTPPPTNPPPTNPPPTNPPPTSVPGPPP